MRTSSRRLGAVLLAASVGLGLVACSDDSGTQSGVTPATTKPALTQAEIDELVAVQESRLAKAVRRFEACDESAVAGYGFNTCWPRAERGSLAAAKFADALADSGAPDVYANLVARLERLGKAWPVVRKGCRSGNDQTCDQALMRFRNDLQQVRWELELF